MKPSNVLLDQQGGREHAYLADFGLTQSARRRRAGRRAAAWVPSTTSRRSRSAASTWTDAPTCTRSAACCSRRSPARSRSRAPSDVAVAVRAPGGGAAARVSERRPELPAGDRRRPRPRDGEGPGRTAVDAAATWWTRRGRRSGSSVRDSRPATHSARGDRGAALVAAPLPPSVLATGRGRPRPRRHGGIDRRASTPRRTA